MYALSELVIMIFVTGDSKKRCNLVEMLLHVYYVNKEAKVNKQQKTKSFNQSVKHLLMFFCFRVCYREGRGEWRQLVFQRVSIIGRDICQKCRSLLNNYWLSPMYIFGGPQGYHLFYCHMWHSLNKVYCMYCVTMY